MEFRGETRYIIVDETLIELIEDLREFRRIEREFEYESWNHFHKPTDNDKKRKKAFYSDKTMSDKFFNKLELNRHRYKTSLKEEGKNRFVNVEKGSENLLNQYKNTLREYNTYLKNKHEKTLKEYSFFSDVFELICPMLFVEH